MTSLLHFGGNGHASIRLDAARLALGRRCPDLSLVDVPYPGFEGRPRSSSRAAFFDDLAGFCRSMAEPPVAAYASGIGALIALGLRSRGELLGVPMIFQGPVLWGLEARAFPKVMRRFPPARGLLRLAFGLGPFRKRFARKQFLSDPGPAFLDEFFEGYARCSAFGDFFDWFDPAWLRDQERAFGDPPQGLQNVEVWIGGQDHVVGLPEVQATELALGVSWPVTTFDAWGHYPMIDDPEGWADATARRLA